MTTVSAAGISVDLPAGWEGAVYERPVEAVEHDDGTPFHRRLQPTSRAVAHLANFPLPVHRGDYGQGAVETMGREAVLVILFEFEPESATEALFSHSGMPTIRAEEFDPDQMQRPQAPLAGIQRFFNVDGRRAFCLYTVIGDLAGRAELAQRVTDVVDKVRIDT